MFRDAESYSRAAAQRMREIADWQEQRRKGDLDGERLAMLRSGISGAVASARLGLFEDFDVERAAQAALTAGRR